MSVMPRVGQERLPRARLHRRTGVERHGADGRHSFFLGSNRVMGVALGRSPESEHQPNLHQLAEVIRVQPLADATAAQAAKH